MNEQEVQVPLPGSDVPSREPARAKDVAVCKLFRAECHRPDCGWTGREHATYQDANTERLAHLNWHILGEG